MPANQPETTEVMTWLREQWDHVAQVDDIGPDDNFFDYGGSSMHLVDLHSLIVDHFDLLDLPLVELFEHTTPRSLAARIQARLTDRVP